MALTPYALPVVTGGDGKKRARKDQHEAAINAALGERATAAQGAKADSAVQPADIAAPLAKLAGIQAGAQVNTVTSVADKTGAVTLEKADVGLGIVNNTSDADKPVSIAQAAAIAAEALARSNADTAEALARSSADAALDGRLDPVELHIRPLNEIVGDEFEFAAPSEESGFVLPVRHATHGRVIGGFAADGVVGKVLRLLSGDRLISSTPESGYMLAVMDRLGRAVGITPGGQYRGGVILEDSVTDESSGGGMGFRARDGFMPLLRRDGYLDAPVPVANVKVKNTAEKSIQLLPEQHIVCAGTSQTQGYPGPEVVQPYPTFLQDMFSSVADMRHVSNWGAGAQNSSQIAARMAGKPITVTITDNTATYGENVLVTDLQPPFMTTTWGPAAAVTVAGVRGMLFRTGGVGNPVYFRADPIKAGTVSIPANSLVTFDPLPFHKWTAIFEIVQNIPDKDIEVWRADIMACVSSLKVAQPRYLVIGGCPFADNSPLGPDVGPGWPIGSTYYNQLLALHADMERLCGDRFFNVHTYLMERGVEDAIALGLLASKTADDIADIAAGWVPRALRYDNLHFNSIAHELIARQIFLRFQLMGW